MLKPRPDTFAEATPFQKIFGNPILPALQPIPTKPHIAPPRFSNLEMSSRSSMSSNRQQLIVSLENPCDDAISYQTIRVGCGGESPEYLDIELRRTLRLPNDSVRRVPAGFGSFPLYLTDSFASKLPSSVKGGGAFIPIYRKHLYIDLPSRYQWISIGPTSTMLI